MGRLKTRVMLVMALAMCAGLMSGCVYNRHRAREAKAYAEAQSAALVAQKPIFEIEAAEGQQITLGGVKALRVYAPRDATIKPLPVQQSGALGFANNLVNKGFQYFGLGLASDFLTSAFHDASANGGDHSVTNIADSYNTRGDEIVDSNLIYGDVSGPGSGIGTEFTDDSLHVDGTGNLVGDGSELANGDSNFNSGHQGDEVDDHSARTCTAAGGAAGAQGGGTTDCGNH